jgi:hypothetical protein
VDVSIVADILRPEFDPEDGHRIASEKCAKPPKSTWKRDLT